MQVLSSMNSERNNLWIAPKRATNYAYEYSYYDALDFDLAVYILSACISSGNFLLTAVIFKQVELLPVDRLKVLKQQIIEQAGLDSPQMFPLFEDRFPTQVIRNVKVASTIPAFLLVCITKYLRSGQ